MFYLLYNTTLRFLQPVYLSGAPLLSRLKEFKASRAAGRARLLAFLQEKGADNIVWLHAASVGELDQALALAREIRKREKIESKYGDSAPLQIIASVFSLSVKKTEADLPDFDLIFYLPIDLPAHWEDLLERFRPLLFATMTWDVWPNLLRALGRREIPAYLCSAALAADSPRLRGWRARLLKPVYENFTGIGTVDQANRERFLQLLPDPDRVKATGDTRYDTILHKIASTKLDPATEQTLKTIKGDHPLWVLASTYAADDAEIFPRLPDLFKTNPTWRVFIFPHHIDEERLREVEASVKATGLTIARFSALSARANEQPDATDTAAPDCVLVDRMGILALAYSLGEFCYVGGGFHHRIHNTAEPAVLGLPIITGPRIDTSPIALDLEQAGALRRASSGQAVIESARAWMASDRECKSVGKTAAATVMDQSGAAARFYDAFLHQLSPNWMR